jgi:hypothetical protein
MEFLNGNDENQWYSSKQIAADTGIVGVGAPLPARGTPAPHHVRGLWGRSGAYVQGRRLNKIEDLKSIRAHYDSPLPYNWDIIFTHIPYGCDPTMG